MAPVAAPSHCLSPHLRDRETQRETAFLRKELENQNLKKRASRGPGLSREMPDPLPSLGPQGEVPPVHLLRLIPN